ncbi:Lrp/AsnC family transcriptional regulator [Halobium palmae]|uniref:Lrp/AsnC family transcriptional regulator n=1 Tax=Halobium palmae TaxID=1776492 RepID=A0ABD5RUY9_9EURY
MVTAYVMVKANTGEADRVKSEMADLDGVESVSIVAGDVDFIVKVSVDQPAQVKTIVADHVQLIDGVEDTQTYISMD